MGNCSKSAAAAMLGAGLCLAWGGSAWARLVPAEVPERSRPAFATSLAFDLRPQVDRASFNLRRPGLRDLYAAIAEAYGIRLLYDRELEEPRLASDFRLQDATLRQALEAAESISKTFVAPVDERTGMVAADTPQKRGEYERQVLATFLIDNPTAPEQLAEISAALRSLLEFRRVAQDPRSNWISARGRPRQVAAAAQFVQTLEKAPGEVMLEVEILEFNIQRARELGVLPPQPFRLLFRGESLSPLAVPVLTFGQGQTLYGVNLPGAEARLSSFSSLARSLQKLQLRASDGQQVSLLVGERFPFINAVLTASFLLRGGAAQQPSVADLGLFPSVQYEDLGVVVRATPFLHADRELTLRLDLALRALAGRELNGLPIIANRQATGQVRLRDGESFLISGLLVRSERASRSGFPFLSRLPLVGRLFGGRSKQERENELLILIRPHILRLSPAEEYASRAIFFGRELAGLPPEPEPPAAGAPPPAGQPPVQVPPGIPQPGTQPQTVPPGALPPALFPQGVVPPGFPQPNQPRQQEP